MTGWVVPYPVHPRHPWLLIQCVIPLGSRPSRVSFDAKSTLTFSRRYKEGT